MQYSSIASRRLRNHGTVDRASLQDFRLVFPARHEIQQRDTIGGKPTFSIKLNIYFIVLWNVSSSTAWGPIDK